MCVLFSQKNFPDLLQKNVVFLRKHDFSRNLEGGTGLQGVSFNLNLNCTAMKTIHMTLKYTFLILPVQVKYIKVLFKFTIFDF